MDWTAGYAPNLEYTAGFYREQSPSFLNFVCVLNGYEPVSLDKPFTYFELGFGRGLTANVLAAANPQGQFYAADFNPAHVVGAQQLVDAAQLDNLHLLENSFAELAEEHVPDLPQFDFITLHGIYAWVAAENRQHITHFIARYLKPGGIVYISYNAMPGWAAIFPLQRLMVEHADLFPNRSDLQLKAATTYIEQLVSVQAGYFVANPVLKSCLDTLKTANPNYLVHDYMQKTWQPLYHADVARDLANAKMDYVGSAELVNAYPELYLSDEKLELINSLPNSTSRETMKDYLLNSSFRKDVFVRGARKMGVMRQAECLSEISMALLVPRASVNLKIKLAFGEANAHADVYEPVLDALAKRPHTLAELAKLPELKNHSITKLGQICAILSSSVQTAFYFSNIHPVAVDAAKRMNRALAAQTRYSDEFQALTSPILGNAINANFIERLVYLLVSQTEVEPELDNVVQHVAQIMASQGRRVMKNGVAIEREAETLTELKIQIAPILQHKLPMWRQLKMI